MLFPIQASAVFWNPRFNCHFSGLDAAFFVASFEEVKPGPKKRCEWRSFFGSASGVVKGLFFPATVKGNFVNSGSFVNSPDFCFVL